MLTTRQAIVLCLFAEAIALVVPFAIFGTGGDGAAVAARVTARFSAVIFSVALALHTRPAGASLMYGFAAAHTVHYAAVVYLAVVATEHHLHHLTMRTVVVLAFGTLLVGTIAATATAREIWKRRLNAFAVYLAWLTFVGATILNGVGLIGPARWPALIPLPPLLAGFAYHLREAMRASVITPSQRSL